MDTDAAMNAGNKDYHLWCTPQFPIMVIEYLLYIPETEYDVVQLLTALNLNFTHQCNTHIQMIDVIRYRTPYLVHVKDPLILTLHWVITFLYALSYVYHVSYSYECHD